MKRLAVTLNKMASRANIGTLPKPKTVPNKRRKLLEKARRKDDQ